MTQVLITYTREATTIAHKVCWHGILEVWFGHSKHLQLTCNPIAIAGAIPIIVSYVSEYAKEKHQKDLLLPGCPFLKGLLIKGESFLLERAFEKISSSTGFHLPCLQDM